MKVLTHACTQQLVLRSAGIQLLGYVEVFQIWEVCEGSSESFRCSGTDIRAPSSVVFINTVGSELKPDLRLSLIYIKAREELLSAEVPRHLPPDNEPSVSPGVGHLPVFITKTNINS